MQVYNPVINTIINRPLHSVSSGNLAQNVSKPTDRHMYLNYSSEHPMSLKRSIPYSQFLRLKRIHSDPQYLLEAQIQMYLFFILREYPHDVVFRAWMKTNRFTRVQLLTLVENNQDKDIPLMFITTYIRVNPNFEELFFQSLGLLRQIKCYKRIGKAGLHDYLQEATSLKDMLVRAKLLSQEPLPTRAARDPVPANIAKKKSPNQGESKT